MRVLTVNNQNKNLSFGTKVIIKRPTRQLLQTFPKEVKDNIYAQRRALMLNGVDDVLTISHDNNDIGYKGQPFLRGWVNFVCDNVKYRTIQNFDGRDFIYDTVYNWDCAPNPRIANLNNIYINAKYAAVPVNKQ